MNKNGKIAIVSAIILALCLAVFLVYAAKPQCNDSQDNDNDGYTDYPDDPGCSSKNDKTETNPAIECDDGSDNDGDNDIDMADGGCSSPTDNDETNCGDSVCEGGETYGTCPADCPIPDSCNDTDGGNIPTTFGTTSGYLDNNPYSNDDYCVDSSEIMEYYCSGDYEQSQQQSCGTDGYGSHYCSSGNVYRDFTDYFCASGECEFNVTPELVETCDNGCTAGQCDDSCSDTDGGDVPFTFGTVSGHYNGFPYSADDICVDAETISEKYCSGDQKADNNQSCGTDFYGSNYCTGDSIFKDWTDYFCASGECDSDVTPVWVENCTDDFYGSNYCIGDAIYRNFTDEFCASGACDFTETPQWVEDCDFGCTAGECDSPPDSCDDTDSGWDYFTQGTISGYDNGFPYNDTDFCITGSLLNEFACSGADPTSGNFSCGAANMTCSNGACV